MCIRESLRLHAPVQAVTRKYNQDMALPGRRIVPKGERGRGSWPCFGSFLIDFRRYILWLSVTSCVFLWFHPRGHLSGQYLRDTPQPCRLDQPWCEKWRETHRKTSVHLSLFEPFDLFSFRSFVPCVLAPSAQRNGLPTPTSPSPRAPGTESLLL